MQAFTTLGVTLHNYGIPIENIARKSIFLLYCNPDIFPKAETLNPEHWLEFRKEEGWIDIWSVDSGSTYKGGKVFSILLSPTIFRTV
jgi:hypothetical protein